MRRTAGLGLIGALGALALMRHRDAGVVIDATPDEPPIEPTDGLPLSRRHRPAVIATEPAPKELSESDARALAAAQAKRDRRAARLVRLKEDRT